MLKSFAEGYKPQVDWGGGGGGDASLFVGGRGLRVGAWRQKLLYSLLAVLLILAVVNFLTTLWVLSKASFNTEGLGALHVEVGGLHLKGRSWLHGTTNTRTLRSRPRQDLKLLGYHNTTVYGLRPDGSPITAMVLDTMDATVFAKSLRVATADGEDVFFASTDGAAMNAETLIITGEDGAVIDGSIQTGLLLAQPQQQLSVESSTRGVTMTAGRDVSIEARDGDIAASSLDTVTFATRKGEIRFLTPSLHMPLLELHGEDHEAEAPPTGEREATTTQVPETQIPSPRLGRPSPTTPTATANNKDIKVYQVCVCPSGKLFLAPATSTCVPGIDTCR